MSGHQRNRGGRPPRRQLDRQDAYNNDFAPPTGPRANANLQNNGMQRGQFRGGRGPGSSSGGAGFQGRGRGRGFGIIGGDAGIPHGISRGNATGGSPANAPTGPRSDRPDGANASNPTDLALPVECYKPPEHDYADQEDVHKQSMGMDERDTNCLRCGQNKGLVPHARNQCSANCVRCPDDPQHPPTYCPRLYCTRAWHKRHGFGKMMPKDEAKQGLCRIRPSDEEIDKLVAMGQSWASRIKRVATFSSLNKRTVGDALGDDAESAEHVKRLQTTNSQLNARLLEETQRRKAAEQQLQTERAAWLAKEANFKRIIFDYQHGVGASSRDALATHQDANCNQDTVGLDEAAAVTAEFMAIHANETRAALLATDANNLIDEAAAVTAEFMAIHANETAAEFRHADEAANQDIVTLEEVSAVVAEFMGVHGNETAAEFRHADAIDRESRGAD